MMFFKKEVEKLLNIFLLVIGTVRLSSGEYEPAYLKVCGKNEKHTINSKMCDKGIWLRNLLEPGCVCVRGVWTLSNGFCDEKAVIIVGDGHCFHIGFEIRSAKLVGDPADPFKPQIYAAPSSLDVLYELGESRFTPALQSDSSLIIGVNPRQVAQRKDFGVCLDLPPGDWEKPVHIYVNPRRSVSEWKLNPKDTFTCPVVTPYKYHVGFGDMFIKDRVEPKLLVERNCAEDCPGSELKSTTAHSFPMGRSLNSHDSDDRPQRFKSKHVSSSDTPVAYEPVYAFSKTVTHALPKKTQEEMDKEKQEARALAEQDDDIYAKETNEQTLRMMHAHISPLLLNVSGATVNTREYKYFQLMRQVVERACPQDFVPKLLVRGLMRMFRQLLWETQDTFTQSESGDDDQHQRTMEVLTFCMNSTNEPSVLFTELSDSYSNNTRDPARLTHAWKNHSMLPPERCPDPFIFSVNSTNYNRTHYSEKNLFLKNISQFWPVLKFNTTEMDFVIETAWKIVTMAHYRCSKYFNESSYTDYSNIFHRMESFFNEKIIRRWYYKPSVDATYKIIQLIFPSYDLKRFAFGIDTCYLGIQKFSDFDYQMWVHRPKVPGTEDDLTKTVPGKPKKGLEAEYWPSHLSTFDYAPNPKWPNPFFQFDKNIYPTPPPDKHGRRKRAASLHPPYNITFDLWGNQARCIHSYLEPFQKPTAFGYHVPPGCVNPTTEF